MRGVRPLLMAALVSLFLAEGQRAFFASLFGLGYEALFPTFRLVPAAVAVAFLLVLLTPLLPLARWLDRRGAVAVAALGAAAFRLPMTHPALETRLVGGALVLASAATFLTWAVGYVDRRALAGGVVVGLVVDQLLRLAGGSYDLSLHPGWLPVQAVLSLGLILVVVLWTREPRDRGGEEGLERRAGGLRLRGALALGALLFFELHVLGMPPVVARWAGVSHGLAGVAVGLAGAAALGATLLLRQPTRGRVVTLLLAALVAGAAILGYVADGTAVAVIMAGGHGAALLLVTRALDPASGRRSAGRVVLGFAVLVVVTALYSLTFYPAFTIPVMDGGAPWVFAAAGLLLAACFALLPRPAVMAPGATLPGALLVISVVLAVVLLAVAPGGGAAWPEGRSNGTAPATGPRIRVATWNIHYGFDERWRFDPGVMAETLRWTDADVVALQEVPVGSPTAYGVDFPFWLARRTGLRHHFSPTINGLLGDAFLTRRAGARADAMPLPAGGGDRKQLLRLTVDVAGRPVTFNALHLGVREPARVAQIEEALATLRPGPAVVLGDLNAEAGDAITTRLAEAGFRDVFHDAPARPPTFPARQPTRTIDWIWVRGFSADSAAVLPVTPSDHRPVVATLHILNPRIR